MKQLFILFVGLLFSSSCEKNCYDILRIAVLEVTYSGLDTNTMLRIHSEEEGNDEVELNADNNYTYRITFPSESSTSEYSFVLGDSLSVDVISEMSYNLTGKCNNDLENFQYKHNGIVSFKNRKCTKSLKIHIPKKALPVSSSAIFTKLVAVFL